MYFTVVQIIILHLLQHNSINVEADLQTWRHSPIRYVDYNNDYHDVFFDRLVTVSLDIANFSGNGDMEKTNIAPGVLISSERVLTAFNPFRKIIHNKPLTQKVYAMVFRGRTRWPSNNCYYSIDPYRVRCARQVMYLPETDIPDEMWHGFDRKHCPLHDLIVLRLNQTIFYPGYPSNYIFTSYWPANTKTTYYPGPFLTTLADPTDRMGETFKFASLGYRNDKEIKSYFNLHATAYAAEDKALVDCDEWLPREWGRFICILNKDNHAGLGAGAMLFSKTKLFGVGCFAFFRSGTSILVFTDVRPYKDHIMQTCTNEDMQT